MGECEAATPVCPPGEHAAHHRHHLLMRSSGGTDDPVNLLPVCAEAHRYIHDHPAESYERGWLRHRWDADNEKRRQVMGSALAAVYTGAGEGEAQAVLDQLSDLGARLEVTS